MNTEYEAWRESAKQEVFDYLDKLRESGETNMFGAAPYVSKEFRINMIEARKFLTEWMETFRERHPL